MTLNIRRISGLCALLALAVALIVLPGTASAQSPIIIPVGGTATITGTVTGPDGQPLSGICVGAAATDFSSFGSAASIADGTYTITGLQDGKQYKVTFSGCGQGNYVPQSTNATASATGVDAHMEAGATISGTVTDNANPANDLANICVTASESGAAPGAIPAGGGAITAANGQYSIIGLPHKKYTVDFKPCPAAPGQPSNGNWLEQWWHGESASGSADVIDATSTLDNPNTNATMQPGATISGHVTDKDGNDLASVCVTVDSTAAWTPGSIPPAPKSTETDANGDYSVGGLSAGGYKVEFASCPVFPGFPGPTPPNVVTQWWNGKSTQAAADTIQLTSGGTHDNTDAQMQPGSAISGQVTGAGNQPLHNACVAVTEGSGSVTGTTDSSGNYTVQGLSAGSHKVEFQGCSNPGLAAEWYQQKPSEGSADAVTTTAGQTTQNINAQLKQPGSISGHVKDGSANALANVCVAVYDGSTNDGLGMFDPIKTERTSGTGDYSITGLPEGSYKLRFTDCGTSESGDMASQTYNNKPDLTSADTVAVTAGQTTQNNDTTLAQGGDIAGQVSGTNNSPASSVCVGVLDGSGNLIDGTTTGTDGFYFINGLKPGTYKVVFQSAPDCAFSGRSYTTQYWNAKPDLASSDGVTVTAGNVTGDVNGQLTATGGALSGHVTAGGNDVSGICVEAFKGDGEPGAGFIEPASTTTDANGHYTLDALPAGSYTVEFTDCRDNPIYVPQFFSGASDPGSATPVDVTDGNTHTGVDAALVEGGRISGHVTDGSSNLEGMCVSAVSTEPSGTDGFSNTDSSGNYVIHGLATGSYKVVFSDCTDDGSQFTTQWWNNKPDFDHADSTSATVGQETQHIDATLVPAPGAAPNTSILTQPDNPTKSTSASFTFQSSPQGATFECKLDDGGFGSCSSGKSYTGLKDGSHTFQVRATSNGHTDPTPASFSWIVDTTAPNTTIDSGPTVNGQDTSFAFSSDDQDATFECQVDSGGFNACTSGDPFPNLTSGSHTFQVRATDQVGNTDATPATLSFGSAPAGGTVSNGSATTPDNPVMAAITTPTGGPVTIAPSSSITTPPPSGWAAPFGEQLVITAPDATVDSPLQLVFTIDASAIPSGTDTSTITVTRKSQDGTIVAAPNCADSSGHATPDPCVSNRQMVGGNLQITILSSHASTWNFVKPAPPANNGGGNNGGGSNSGNTGGSTGGNTGGGGVHNSGGGTVTHHQTGCVVPKLKGMTTAKAKKALAKAHCKLGKIKKKKAPKKTKHGVVISTTPGAGANKPAGTKINLVVAK